MMTGMSRVFGPRADLAAELDARDVGQHPVEQHEVRLDLVDRDQRLVAVGRGRHGEAFLLEVVLRVSSVAKSSASSVRPISTSDTTVCSRLAASWFCERSDSASPRTVSSSPATAWISVWSRSVTTRPTSRPCHRAGAVFTTSTASSSRWISSGAALGRQHGAGQRVGEAELGHGPTDGALVERQQPLGAVVEQLHAPLGVDEEQALADGVQHRVVVLVHPGDLAARPSRASGGAAAG